MREKERQVEVITTKERLAALADQLVGEPIVAFDLEADSMHHYQEKVCLIQVSIPSVTALIDPLALPDVAPLAPVMVDPLVRKVFHGADYDIRSLYRDFGIVVNNLFDTMIACQLLGEKEVGLAAVLRKRFGVELDKTFQKADWSRRPLKQEMLDYASEDTQYLIELHRQLIDELTERGRLSWVEEEAELVSKVRAADRTGEPLYLRFKGAGRMPPRDLAVLDGLLRLRDRRARQSDLPPFKILGNETLGLLAVRKPEKAADLTGIPGLSPRLIERYGTAILEAVAAAMALPADRLPRIATSPRPKRDRATEERLKKLKEWRESTSKELGIEGGLILNNTVLEALAERVPASVGELEAIPAMRRWQRREFGSVLIALLRTS